MENICEICGHEKCNKSQDEVEFCTNVVSWQEIYNIVWEEMSSGWGAELREKITTNIHNKIAGKQGYKKEE